MSSILILNNRNIKNEFFNIHTKRVQIRNPNIPIFTSSRQYSDWKIKLTVWKTLTNFFLKVGLLIYFYFSIELS